MTEKLSTIFIWITMLVSATVIAVMILLGEPKKEVAETEPQTADLERTERVFYEKDESLAENSIQICLPPEIKEQQIVIENDYMNKTLRIKIARQPESTWSEEYFYQNPMRVNALVGAAKLSESTEDVTISLPFESVFEWEMKIKKEAGNNCLDVQLVRPRDKYEKIIVLDAGHGGADSGDVIFGEDESVLLAEKDLTFSVVSKAGKLLEKEGVCVYYTRDGETNPTQEQRVSLANEIQADMLISVHADYDDDTSLYGMRTIYNETYFIPEFASADLAYLLLEKVAASTNEKAIGFEPGTGEAELVQQAMVPVSQLYIGYLSNKQEQKLLGREEHIDRIATGICEAVLEGYEEMKK